MKNYKKIIIISFLCIIVLSVFVAVEVRKSIWELKDDYIEKNINNMIFSTFPNEEYLNGLYLLTDEVRDISTESDIIVVGKATGQREFLEDMCLTEIEISSVIKGNLNKEKINICEPISVNGLSVFSACGYNFLNYDKEYIFCLKDNTEVYNYLYMSPSYGKFPVNYKEEDFIIVNEEEFNERPGKYIEYKKYEQLFPSESQKVRYFEEYDKLMSKYKSNINVKRDKTN